MKVSGIIIVVSAVVLAVSFWNRNRFPDDIAYVPSILEEPLQKKTRKQPFAVRWNNVSYRVDPKYEYDLTGMVVSFRHHEGNSRMHRRSNDYLNMLDVCVIWGDNTRNTRLNKISFWNGIFSCRIKTRDSVAWSRFNMEQLSNNHLLSADDRIRDKVRNIKVGDQIRFTGYLSAYRSPGIPERGTSTTRTDEGDGACETVFVESFDILRPVRSPWRMAMWASLATLLLGLALHFKRPYKPY